MMKMMLMTKMMKVDLFSVVSTVSSSEKRYEDKNIWLSKQIQLAILTNTICSLDKYMTMDLFSVVNTVSSSEERYLVDESGATQQVNL